jgi:hypothetical protein
LEGGGFVQYALAALTALTAAFGLGLIVAGVYAILHARDFREYGHVHIGSSFAIRSVRGVVLLQLVGVFLLVFSAFAVQLLPQG